MAHTDACLKAQATWSGIQAVYRAAWPEHCKTCYGWGTVGHGTPATQWEPGEPPATCSDCVEKGICPRCGKPTLNEDCDSCTSCDWGYGEAGSEGLPEQPECWCWEAEAEAMLDWSKRLDEQQFPPLPTAEEAFLEGRTDQEIARLDVDDYKPSDWEKEEWSENE